MTTVTDDRADQVTREDLLLFASVCLAATSQREFHTPVHVALSDTPWRDDTPTSALDFVHAYVLGNYRRLYARMLAIRINDHNRQRIVVGLLASGRTCPPEERAEEGALIRHGLRHLPTHRALEVFQILRRDRVNNRRSRAALRAWLAHRGEVSFVALKYGGRLRGAVRHGHVRLPDEVGAWLFRSRKQRSWQDPLLATAWRARFSQEAIYDLPYTLAEGYAARRGIPRDKFLARIAPRLTQHERLRLTASAAEEGVDLGLDLSRVPLTRLALFWLSLDADARAARREVFRAGLVAAAARVASRAPRWKRLGLVLDRSWSTSGSVERRRRPLAVALGVWFLAHALADEVVVRWSLPVDDPLDVDARGSTDLTDTLLDVLASEPEVVVVVSDGFDNAPHGGASAVAGAYRRRVDPAGRVRLVHVNPVFDASRLGPRALGPDLPLVGVRDAEDLPAALAFAGAATGPGGLAALEAYLSRASARARVALDVAEEDA